MAYGALEPRYAATPEVSCCQQAIQLIEAGWSQYYSGPIGCSLDVSIVGMPELGI